jgi:RHH-type transcriptional regulator, rel operon repressor / antitoxin RelB
LIVTTLAFGLFLVLIVCIYPQRKKDKIMTVQIAVRVPEEVVKRLDRLARKTKRTRTYYVRQAILEHLQDLEDYYLALSRQEDSQPTIPFDEMERRLGLAD